jgi:hypothetical protein
MISLKSFIQEALEPADKFSLGHFIPLEKYKTKSGKKVYWASATGLSNCFLPGKGKVNKRAAQTIIMDKLSKYIANELKIDTSEVYRTEQYTTFYTRSVESRLHFICDNPTKAEAQKLERADDYVFIVRFGFEDHSEYKEAALKNKLIKLFNVKADDVFVEVKQSASKEFDTLYATFTIYTDYDGAANVLAKL